jgi:hypothetical protein
MSGPGRYARQVPAPEGVQLMTENYIRGSALLARLIQSTDNLSTARVNLPTEMARGGQKTRGARRSPAEQGASECR